MFSCPATSLVYRRSPRPYHPICPFEIWWRSLSSLSLAPLPRAPRHPRHRDQLKSQKLFLKGSERYLPCIFWMADFLFCKAMLDFMVLLFNDPSLDWDLWDSVSPRLRDIVAGSMEVSGFEELAMLANLIPVSAISLLMSSAISGEWDLTDVWSWFALAKENK